MSLFAPPAAASREVLVWGGAGTSRLPAVVRLLTEAQRQVVAGR